MRSSKPCGTKYSHRVRYSALTCHAYLYDLDASGGYFEWSLIVFREMHTFPTLCLVMVFQFPGCKCWAFCWYRFSLLLAGSWRDPMLHCVSVSAHYMIGLLHFHGLGVKGSKATQATHCSMFRFMFGFGFGSGRANLLNRTPQSVVGHSDHRSFQRFKTLPPLEKCLRSPTEVHYLCVLFVSHPFAR